MAYSTGYDFRLVRAGSTAPIGGVQNTNYSTTSAAVVFPSSEAPGTFQGQARSRATGFVGDWGEPFPITKPASPAVTGLSITAGQAVATWANVPGNNGYQARLVDAQGAPVGQIATAAKDATSAPIDIPAGLAAGAYRAQALMLPPAGGIPGDWGPLSTVTIARLAAPTVSALTYAAPKATVTWNNVSGNGGYTLRIVDAGSAPVGNATAAPTNATTGSVALPDDLPPGVYKAQIQTLASGTTTLPSSWSAASTATLTRLAPPQITKVSVASGKLSVSWDAVPNSGGYDLRLVTEAGRSIGTFSAPGTATAGQWAPPDGPAGVWRVQAMTKTTAAQRIPSAWSALSTDQVTKLAAPAVSSLTYSAPVGGAAGQAKAHWNNLAGNAGYELRIIDSAGKPVDAATTTPANATSASAGLPGDLAVGAYYGQVQAQASGNRTIPSAWGDRSNASLTRLAAPAIHSMTASGLTVSSGWSAVANNGGYLFEVLAPDGTTVAASTTTPANKVQASVDLPASSPPGTYHGRVQTLPGSASGSTSFMPSAWSAIYDVQVQAGARYVTLGPAGRSGSPFDDTAAAKQVGIPITKVVVRSGQIVDSIQAFNGNQQMPQHGGDRGTQTIVTLDPGDAITEVSGYYGPWYGTVFLLQLTLKTANGKTYGPLGTMGGSSASSRKSFSFSTPGGRLIAFSGSTASAPEADGSMSSFVSSLGATFVVSDQPDGPIPTGFAPIIASSATALINSVFNVQGSAPKLAFGRFNKVASTITATEDSGYYKILLALGTQGKVFTASNTVVCCANHPLSEWDWYDKSYSFAGIRSVWTASGWIVIPNSGTDHLDEAVALGGLYFYKIEMTGQQVPGDLGAFIASKGQPATIAFLTAPPAAQAGLFPTGFAPILAISAAGLIDRVFDIEAEAPEIEFGQFDGSTANVTATPDSSKYKVLFALASSTTFYPVTNTVVGCSPVKLDEWNWYQRASTFVGTRSAWTANGWQTVANDSHSLSSQAVAVAGLYFYKIELDKVEMGANLGCYIQSSGRPAVLAFYTMPRGDDDPVPRPRLQDCTFTKRLEIPFSGTGIVALDSYFDAERQLIAYAEYGADSRKNTLVLYDYRARARTAELSLESWVKRVRFFNQGKNIAFCESGATSITILDGKLKETTSLRLPGLGDFTTSRDGKRLVALRNSSSVQIFDLTDQYRPLATFSFPGQPFANQKILVGLSEGAKAVAIAGGYQKDFLMYGDLDTGDFELFKPGATTGCYSPAFLADDQTVVVGGGYGDGRLYVVDVTTKSTTSPVKPARNYIYNIDPSADRRYLVCGGYDGSLSIYSVTDWKKIFTMQLGLVNAVQFTRDMRYIVSAHGAGSGAKVVVLEIVPGNEA